MKLTTILTDRRANPLLSFFLRIPVLLIYFGVQTLAAQQVSEGVSSRLEAAYRLSWDHHYQAALLQFDTILAVIPDHADAQRGRGYTLAWKGDYSAAGEQFERLIARDPEDWEARKGLAYVALWSGDGKKSAEIFEELVAAREPQDELAHSLGMAYLIAGNQRAARNQLPLITDEARATALASAVQAERARLEFLVWGGWTRVEGNNQMGIRAAQVSWNPRPQLGAWVRMDHTLGIDHPALFLRDSSSLAVLVGGTIQPGPHLSLKAELGLRSLPGQRNQQLLVLEQTWFVHPRLAWKLGAFAAADVRAGANVLAHTGVSWHMGGKWWLEPTAYAAWVENNRFDQFRFSLAGKYHALRGHEVNLGILAGNQNRGDFTGRKPVLGGWLQYQHPLMERHWLFLHARYETSPTQPFINLSAGFRFRLEK